MFKLTRLYSYPEAFDEIQFHSGLNIILGETKEDNHKTNGVGKSLVVDFINFCLLKKYKDCRISLIPESVLPQDTAIILEFEFDGVPYKVIRSPKNHNNPRLQSYLADLNIEFSNLEDATEYFTTRFIKSNASGYNPSFRTMLGPLIRDEKSEFKSIVLCHDTSKRIPADYTPHLYLLNINAVPYIDIKRLWSETDKVSEALSKIKSDIQALTGKNYNASKAELNELTSQVQKIKNDIDTLENTETNKIISDEIAELEDRIDRAKSKQAVLRRELVKTKIANEEQYIPNNEIEHLYNQLSEGLGSLIKRQLDEVIGFKERIDDFQRSLLSAKRDEISRQVEKIENELQELDSKYSDKVALLDQAGLLKSLRQTIAIHQSKVEDLSSLSAWFKTCTKYELEKVQLESNRNSKTLELSISLNEANEVLDSFQESILKIHEFIAGNRHCSFDIEINSKTREIIKYNLRIHDDGSHSNEREKVFMYDISLLLNHETSRYHPRLLIHDNIFDVDQDTLVRSLNYLHENKLTLDQRQYILTINIDKFRSEDFERLKWNIPSISVAKLTKRQKFLRTNYQELSHKSKKAR
ncbi:DUF2326 domain-containing protein [Pseudomonas sp. C11]|uniref:DUF2326 domain-containing protein n=1 Tax=Pseudomonas sp. C11 TaxID=3075550 RepID=UPI002AFFB495|nr:DUF2326 domain-containing protein [Pseudomonas sp. C11]